jgi:poly-gamma-glutamate synthesis protein (capsule biosynthesis protein)
MTEMGFNIVSLANNHAFDLGVEGLRNAISLLDKLGIQHFGAGLNLEEAKRPVVINDGNQSIAIFGCMFDYQVPCVFYSASDTNPGVYHTNIEDVVMYVKELKDKYDKVVVMPHWGEEHRYLQRQLFRDYAKRMLSAGADCIIGSHPHIINPVVKWGGKKCYFSLGNFLFPEKCMQVPRPMYYPESEEEYKSLKRMWTYPKCIDEPIVAVWKPRNRIGMMVEMDVTDRIRSHYSLTCLTADNVLHRYSSLMVRFRMSFLSILMHLPMYRFVHRLYFHRYNLLRRFVDCLPAFNIPVKL